MVALVCEPFSDQADLIARACGMPDLPRVRLPFPLAGKGPDAIGTAAGEVVDDVLRALRGKGR